MHIDGWSDFQNHCPEAHVEWVRKEPISRVEPPRAPARAPGPLPLSAGPPGHGKVGVFAVWPDGNVGDRSQSVGIAEAVKTAMESRGVASSVHISEEGLRLSGSSADRQAAWLRTLCEPYFTGLDVDCFDRIVVIGAGSGSNVVATLGEISGRSSVTTIFSGHQLTADLTQASHFPDIVALPKGVVPPAQLSVLEDRTKLILVAGVANQLSKAKIAETLAAYKAKGYPAVPEVDANTIAVILGGDAPDTFGAQRFVTEAGVRDLARHIVAMERPTDATTFVVTNSPRTGRHMLNDNGGAPSASGHTRKMPDPVTAAFVDELQRLTSAAVHLFVFDPANLPSAYLPIIDRYMAAGEDAGHIYVPAESSSMIGETSLLAAKRVVSITQSTNEAHMNGVREELSRTGGTVVHLDGSVEHITQTSTRAAPSAAGEIARALLAWIWGDPTQGKTKADPRLSGVSGQ